MVKRIIFVDAFLGLAVFQMAFVVVGDGSGEVFVIGDGSGEVGRNILVPHSVTNRPATLSAVPFAVSQCVSTSHRAGGDKGNCACRGEYGDQARCRGDRH